MSENLFAAWYKNNKSNTDLQDEYQNYREDIEYTVDNPLGFKAWCKQRWEYEQELEN